MTGFLGNGSTAGDKRSTSGRGVTRRRFLSVAGLAGAVGALGGLAGCSLTESPDKTVIRGTTMGTYYAITYIAGDDTPPDNEVRKLIEQHFQDINNQMSTFQKDSEVSRFNAFREINTPFPVSSGVEKVVREAIRINTLTGGSLDITVGPLVNLWGFGPEGRPSRIPSAESIEKARKRCGIRYLEVRKGALVKKIPDLYIDLSAIAKGYGVDVIAEQLKALDVSRYLVDVGGEVRGEGSGAWGGPWRVAVERPVPYGDAPLDRVIHLVNTSVATSGDYRNYFEEGGHRFSHTIDPRTGRPITHKLASVTVMDQSCMTADGLATGLDVMGPERGMALAEKANIACIMIVKEGTVFREVASSRWNRIMQ